jgi:hypothetical protein
VELPVVPVVAPAVDAAVELLPPLVPVVVGPVVAAVLAELVDEDVVAALAVEVFEIPPEVVDAPVLPEVAAEVPVVAELEAGELEQLAIAHVSTAGRILGRATWSFYRRLMEA